MVLRRCYDAVIGMAMGAGLRAELARLIGELAKNQIRRAFLVDRIDREIEGPPREVRAFLKIYPYDRRAG